MIQILLIFSLAANIEVRGLRSTFNFGGNVIVGNIGDGGTGVLNIGDGGTVNNGMPPYPSKSSRYRVDTACMLCNGGCFGTLSNESLEKIYAA